MLFITVIYTHWLGQSAEPSPFVRSPEDKSNSSSENNKKKKTRGNGQGAGLCTNCMFIHSFIHSFIHLFVRSFVRSFICLSVRPARSPTQPPLAFWLLVAVCLFHLLPLFYTCFFLNSVQSQRHRRAFVSFCFHVAIWPGRAACCRPFHCQSLHSASYRVFFSLDFHPSTARNKGGRDE